MCIARSWGAPPPKSVAASLTGALPSRRRGRSRKSRAIRDKKVIRPDILILGSAERLPLLSARRKNATIRSGNILVHDEP